MFLRNALSHMSSGGPDGLQATNGRIPAKALPPGASGDKPFQEINGLFSFFCLLNDNF